MNTKFFKSILPAIAAGLMFTTCDDIAENDRFIALDPVEAARVVLLEDFTGQNCVNCPEAHEVIEQLQQQYGNSLVAVSIHAGDFGIDKKLTSFESDYVGLMTEEGQTLNDNNGVDTWPAGVVNRRGGVLNDDSWAAAVRSEISRPSDVVIGLNVGLEGDEIKITTLLEPQNDFNNARLNIWVIESGIVARQRNANNRVIKDYVHNNVFRASVTDINGDAVTLKRGIHETFSHKITLRNNEQERWVAGNLSIVAFVADADGVHQAAIAPVVPKDAEDTQE